MSTQQEAVRTLIGIWRQNVADARKVGDAVAEARYEEVLLGAERLLGDLCMAELSDAAWAARF